VNFLSRTGLDNKISHENARYEINVSWMDAPNWAQAEKVIHLVRHPLSICKTYMRNSTYYKSHSNWWERNLKPHIDLNQYPFKPETAWQRILTAWADWNEMIERCPKLVWRFRIEDILNSELLTAKTLVSILGGDINRIELYKLPEQLAGFKGAHPTNDYPRTYEELAEKDLKVAERIKNMAIRYGYGPGGIE